MKKRIICLALAALMVLSAFTLAGCGEKKAKIAQETLRSFLRNL